MMMTRTLGSLGSLFAALVLVGCAETKPAPTSSSSTPSQPVSAADVQEKVDEAAEAAEQLASQKKEEYVRKLDEKMVKLDKSIAEMKEQGADLADDARQQWQESMADLEAKRQAYQKKYAAIAGASGEAWQDLTQGVESAWNDLKQAVANARERFGTESAKVTEVVDDRAETPAGEQPDDGKPEKKEDPGEGGTPEPADQPADK